MSCASMCVYIKKILFTSEKQTNFRTLNRAVIWLLSLMPVWTKTDKVVSCSLLALHWDGNHFTWIRQDGREAKKAPWRKTHKNTTLSTTFLFFYLNSFPWSCFVLFLNTCKEGSSIRKQVSLTSFLFANFSGS